MRRMISIGVLVCAIGASPAPLALCEQDAAPPDERFEMHDLEAGKIREGECTEVREVSGKVTRVERDKASESVAIFRVRADDGKDWTFDALRLKANMRAAVKEEFDAAIAEGDRVEISLYMCGENFERIAVDAIAIRRPD
jgi:hypothetical protein